MAVKKGSLGKGLGKGLDSLIPMGDALSFKNNQEDAGMERTTENPTVTLKITEIEPNREQPRKNFNEDLLDELADSIRQYGMIQPLIVQKEREYYKIIAGERRWRAAKKAGLKEIPVIIKDYTPQQIVEISLIENIQRQDLNPLEEAMAYKRLMEEFQLKPDEIAERVSKSRVAITNAIRLLKLEERVQQMLAEDMITSGHARALLAVENGEEQYLLAMKVFDGKLSVRETERLVKLYLEPKKEKKESVFSESEELAYQKMEEKMKEIFGSKVSIHKRNKSKGKIEIEYYSGEELERLLELIERIQKN